MHPTSAFPLRAQIASGNCPALTEARAETGGPLAVDEVDANCSLILITQFIILQKN